MCHQGTVTTNPQLPQTRAVVRHDSSQSTEYILLHTLQILAQATSPRSSQHVPTSTTTMMKIKEEQRTQLKEMAEKMMARRSKSSKKEEKKPRSSSSSKKEKDDGAKCSSNKDTNQRAKLKQVAQKMKTCKTKSHSNDDKNSTQSPETKSPTRSPRRRSLELKCAKMDDPRRLSLGSLEKLPFEKSPVDLDDSSVSTFTTLENSFHNSYNGSLGGSSRSLFSSGGGNNSSLSRMLGNSQSQLDCSIFLIITNIWETVKRIDGYIEDLAENIICNMMILEPQSDVRRQLGLKSFRSPRFKALARKMVDIMDVLVTMLGPDIDDDELSEIGEGLRLEGVNPKLFGKSVALALRETLGEQEFPKDDFDCWDQAFKFVCGKMEC